MNITQFLRILKARSKIILITFFITVGTTVAISLIMPKSYTATTSLVLNYKGVDPVTGSAMAPQLMPGYIATQTDIITSRNVAIKVVKALKLTEDPGVQQSFKDSNGTGDINEWLADLLLEKLDVKPSLESSVVDVSFTASDPESAAAIANEFASAYQQTNIQLKTEPSQKAADFLDTQAKTLHAKLEAAQTKLASFQQEKGITSATGNLDVETGRLNDLSSQLVMAQSQSDVTANPVVQNLKIDITNAKTKLSDLSQSMGANHPQYLAAQATLRKLEAQLADETNKSSSNVDGTARMYRQRVGEIASAVATQKNRVLELNRYRTELTLLQQDVDNAQRALDATSLRLTQTRLEGNANQTDIAILNPATPPQKPTSPKLLINILLSIFLGGMLGVGFGLIAEMNDRRVRSSRDISELLEVPVFAIIQSPNTPKSRKLLGGNISRRLLKNA
ncbi:MAG: chain length determinant protein EpsF [Sulfuriferula sp.]